MDCIGFDLGKVASQICVITEDGELIERRIKTERESLSKFFGGRARLPQAQEFGGLEPEGVWRRVRTPTWDDDTAVTPAFVRRLIEWCLSPDKEIVRVDWRGRALPEGGAAKAP